MMDHIFWNKVCALPFTLKQEEGENINANDMQMYFGDLPVFTAEFSFQANTEDTPYLYFPGVTFESFGEPHGMAPFCKKIKPEFFKLEVRGESPHGDGR